MKATSILSALALICLSTITHAQTSCSTVAAGNWENNAIWSCGAAPTSSFSGTIIIQHATVQLNSTITMSNLVSVFVRSPGIFRVDGNNSLNLTDNNSKIDIQAGASVAGQNANSIIRIGTSPQFVYSMNGGGNSIVGPIAMTNTGTSLPVELVYFNAKAEGRRVSLSWATANEQNADRFVVERSANLGEFLPVGSARAIGNTSVRQFYGLIDQQPLLGANYYRLRQIDRDGRSVYSRPVAVEVRADQPGLLVLGNPVRGGVVRLSPQDLDGATYQLMSLQGRAIATDAQTQPNGEVTLRLPDQLSTGLYLLQVRYPAGQLTRKLVVE